MHNLNVNQPQLHRTHSVLNGLCTHDINLPYLNARVMTA